MNLTKTTWLIGTLILLAFILRLVGVEVRPFDGDEGVILEAASRSTLSQTINRAYDDAHPPAQAIFTHFFLQLAPLTETTGRLPSVFFGTLAVLGIYLLVNEYVKPEIALTTTILAAISPYLILFAQEQRMYSLLLLSTVFILFTITKFIKTKDWRWLVGFVISSILGLATHHLTIIILIGVVLGLIFSKLSLKQWPVIIGSLLAIFLLYLPQLPHTLEQFSGRAGEQPIGLALAASIKGLANMVYRFGASRLVLGLEPSPAFLAQLVTERPPEAFGLVLAIVIPITLLILGLRHWPKVTIHPVVLPATVSLTILAAAFFSVEIGGRAVRTLIVLAPIYLTFLAIGLLVVWKTSSRWLTFGLVLVFLTGLAKQLLVDYRAPGADAIAQFLAEHAQNGDLVLTRGSFLTGESFVVNYYLKQQPSPPQLEIVDYFGDYRVGNLAQLRARTTDQIIVDSVRAGTTWYYDLTLSGDIPFNAIPHPLGIDKEGQLLTVYQIHPRGVTPGV